MKKRLLGLVLILSLLFAIVACGTEAEHKAKDAWSHDETYHWHDCEIADCNKAYEKGYHDFDEGVVTKEATFSENGVFTYTCKVCGYQKTEEISAKADLSKVLQSKNNDEVDGKGVVFAKTNEGFYINDGNAGIYVRLASATASKLAGLKIGDEVEVTGKFALSNGQPFVKNADVNVLASGKTALTAQSAKFEVINALDGNERSNYGLLYTTVAAVSTDEAQRIVLNDGTSTILLADANVSEYEAFVGKKISTSFVLTAKSGSTWTAYGLKETASEYFVNVNDVKEAIFGSINLPTEVYGKLTLTTTYEAEPGVVFNWTVKTGSSVTIENNVASVKLDLTADENVTLTLTLTSGETTTSQDFTTTVKALEKVSLADGATKDNFVLTTGLVVGSGIADEKSTYQYIIVMDKDTKDFFLIQVGSTNRRSVAIGDEIDFVAKWYNDEDLTPEQLAEGTIKRPCYRNVQVISKVSTGNAVDYATLNPITLETADDYKNAIDNNHELIKLYKVVSPYMVGSGSTTYSWNQFGPSAAAAASGLVNSRQFSLLIGNLAENGLTNWETEYAVPKKTEGAKQYVGTTMYVFSIYQTGETKWAFILPCEAACYFDIAAAAKVAVAAVFSNEINCSEAGTATLPATVTVKDQEYTLTWTSSDDSILNATTGAYAKLYENASVKLTATFTAGDQQYSFEYPMSLLAQEVEAQTISQAIAAAKLTEDGTVVINKLEAYVAAIGASSENKDEYRYGIMLTDGKKVVYYISNEYVVNEQELKYGDKLEFRDATIVVDKDGHTMTNVAKTTLVSSGNEIDYTNLEVDATITNNDEMTAFIGAHGVTHGLVVKFTGEIINFVGCGTKDMKNYRYQLNYKKATSSANARYTFDLESNNSKTICFSLRSIEQLLNQVEESGTLAESTNTWFAKCGMPLISGSTNYDVSGSFYAVGGYNGNTLHAWTVINQKEFNIIPVPESYYINQAIEGAVDVNVVAYEAGTATLLDKVTVGSTEYAITWTSENEAVFNGTTGAYTAVKAVTNVKLTAHYTVGEVAYTYEVTYVLNPTEPDPLTVTEALSLANEAKVTASGVVIAFISDGNSAENNKGFMIMDNATGKVIQVRNIMDGKTYPAYTYEGTETAIAIGDSVKVKGVMSVVADQATFIDLQAAGKVTFLEKVTPNFHEGEESSAVVTINNDAELDTLIKSGDYYNKIIKLVATVENTLHVSGSGTTSSTICNFKLGYHYGDDNGKGTKNQIYYNGITISTKSDVNSPNTDGTTTFSKALYGATRDDGKLGASDNKERVGTLYITICYKTSSYYQASIVNFANCKLEAKPAA